MQQTVIKPQRTLLDLIVQTLDDNKGKDIIVLDVQKLTSITDHMVICSGTSTRHVKALSDKILEATRQNKYRSFGVAGIETCDWVLVDLNDAIVHIMLPESREFYQLEKLWDPRHLG